MGSIGNPDKITIVLTDSDSDSDDSPKRSTKKRPFDGQDSGPAKRSSPRLLKKDTSNQETNEVKDDSVPKTPVVQNAEQMVKKTIRDYNKYCLQLVQEKGETKSQKRPDLMALSKMKDSNEILNTKKTIGHVAGINVGHQFFSRVEMVIVGLHGHWFQGIDYMTEAGYGKMEEYKKYTLPVAVSIVMSGRYEDDKDDLDEVVYTGAGGNTGVGLKGEGCDQVLTKGNLALKNCMDQKVPVRLIRGHARVYTYGGLYNVVDFWVENGASGFLVFKYKLRRIEGQAPLTTNQVYFIGAKRNLQESKGKVCDDISGGQERIPVPAYNLIDSPFVPTGYEYYATVRLPEGEKLPKSAPGCGCKGGCTDRKTCSCAKLNGGRFPYVDIDGSGRLVKAKSVIFECGPNCKCGPDCVNRTSQQGLKYQLELFRTANKGWAVRSSEFIPSGAAVCEYTGTLRRTNDMDSVDANDYIFEIDCLETMEGLGGREKRWGDVSIPENARMEKNNSEVEGNENDPEFCIDAGKTGGVARFINHSCDPNLFVQCVLSSHHDFRRARVMLFSSDNIPPMQELTYDYGYALDSVIGSDGKIKKIPCYCGAKNCRKRLH